jgi:ubiquitin carboxyl-terminal hydrolase 25/28
VFKCSSHDCSAKLVFSYKYQIVSPRDLELLCNPATLKRRYEDAVRADPTREGLSEVSPVAALVRFRRYIKDSLRPEHKGRRIPTQNKRFMEAFGSDCDQLLAKLGFQYSVGHILGQTLHAEVLM